MKALVFHHPGKVEVNDVDDPRIEDAEDVILRVTATAICGSDLHIYNGFMPQKNDMVLGHEFMGIIEETGAGVKDLKKGDRVVIPFPIACGRCFFCHDELPGHCENSNPEKYGPEGSLLDQKGGGLFGYTDLYGGYSGGQAEYVRVPYANFGPRKVPQKFSDEELLFLTDIFPTCYSGIDWAGVKGGETVAVFGCGCVGLSCINAASLVGASRIFAIDVNQKKEEWARKFGATDFINPLEVRQLAVDQRNERDEIGTAPSESFRGSCVHWPLWPGCGTSQFDATRAQLAHSSPGERAGGPASG